MLWLLLQAAPAPSSGAEDKIISLLFGVGGALVIQLLSRGWNRDTREMDQIHEKDVQQDTALLRIELDIRELKAFIEPFKESIRLNLAHLVPRENPLSEQTNRTIEMWHSGLAIPADVLMRAATEVHEEGRADPKLNEAERMMFSATAAGMFHDAERQRTNQIRTEMGLA